MSDLRGPQHNKETELVRRFRDGDEEAFRRLLSRYQRIVHARLDRRMPDVLRRRVSVADVFQDTCVVAFRRHADFQDRGPRAFGNWLLGIAENRLRDEIDRHAKASKRAVGREITRSGRPDTAYLQEAPGSPSRAAMCREDIARIRQAMQRLPEEHQRVLRLALEQGLTLREVAEQTGRTREAVKKIYARSLVRLRSFLASDPEGEE